MARKTAEATEATRQALLRAGLDVFGQRGYAAARLEDVARAAGVTRGAIYWHFSSKAALYGALVAEASARLERVIAAALADGGSYLSSARRVMERMLVYLEEDGVYRAVQGLLLVKTGADPDLRDTYQRQVDEIHAKETQLAAILRAAIASGEVRSSLDPLDGARAMLAYLDGLMLHWLLAPEAFSIAISARALVDIYIRGIAADPGLGRAAEGARP